MFDIAFLLLIFCGEVKALEIVYPKTNPVKINACSTFFIGAANPKAGLKINDIDVKVSPLGAFAQFVPLSPGKNSFKLVSGSEVINF